ncbi:hypothetical protein [Pseudohaliea rubra]|uniref:Uncharacterized protein n=1 Tax=Pseudohaliea rubra DSM 19751 TaxID=1265313 RepID=A0A095XWS5_9GAMM|nr:hypothetical protein [Pseudohaliea rubra]KGE04121.1 hypothetical protein HRUBRA_01345 [Pseudohaliea rubra DSM 19751]
MGKPLKRSTIYFDPELPAEDQEDLAACDDRVAGPELSYQELLDDLRVAHRKQVYRNS